MPGSFGTEPLEIADTAAGPLTVIGLHPTMRTLALAASVSVISASVALLVVGVKVSLGSLTGGAQ